MLESNLLSQKMTNINATLETGKKYCIRCDESCVPTLLFDLDTKMFNVVNGNIRIRQISI